MSIKNMTKEDLELLSNKDITNLLLEEKGKQTTPDLFKKIITRIYFWSKNRRLLYFSYNR